MFTAFILENSVEDECSENPMCYADSVGANLFAHNSLSVRINSHLQNPQLRFLGSLLRQRFSLFDFV